MRSRESRACSWGVAAVVALGTAARATPPPQTYGLDDPRVGAPHAIAMPAMLPLELAGVPRVSLPRPDLLRIEAEDATAPWRSEDKVLRYGVGRDVAAGAEDGRWNVLPGGARVWAVEIASASAIALRVHFAHLRLPAGSRLVVRGLVPAGGTDGASASASDAASDAMAGDSWDIDAPVSTETWSPTVLGEVARLEYFPPAGRRGDGVPFRVDRLQHIYRDPVQAASGIAPTSAGACHNDVTCYPDWRREARAVAGLGVVSGDSLFCTGQLINDQAADFTPYFLTANHCAGNPATAASAELYWFYQTATCGGVPPALGSVPRSVGATLLSANASSDYALLRVAGRLPHGVSWAGWTSRNVADGTPAAVIHHPSGDFKRISFGNKDSTLGCGGGGHLRIQWTDGPTEDGSSGSGAFRADTHQLFAQLHCGPSACGRETYDQFGSFAATYPRVAGLLARGSDDASEPDNTCATARPVAAGTLADRVVKYRDPDWYSIAVPAGKTLVVTVSFVRQNGVLDARLFTACGGAPAVVAIGNRNLKTLRFTNPGAAARLTWEVDLPDDLRNAYTMTVALQ